MARRRKKASKTIIKNYGLMWRRDYVFWGMGGKDNVGRLSGRRSGRVVDFRDQIGIYILYDDSHRPIYVGQAGGGKNKRLFLRLRDHRRDELAHRWSYFSWFGLRGVNRTNGKLSGFDKPTKHIRTSPRDALNEFEGVLIQAMEPPLNKQSGRFPGVVEFYQEDESHDVDPAANAAVVEHSKKLKKLHRSLAKVEGVLKKLATSKQLTSVGKRIKRVNTTLMKF